MFTFLLKKSKQKKTNSKPSHLLTKISNA